MSADESLTANIAPDGVKGLAMMVPAVGLPLAFHLLNGAIITGAGVLALSAAFTPFTGELLKAFRKSSADPDLESSVRVPVDASAPEHQAAVMDDAAAASVQTI